MESLSHLLTNPPLMYPHFSLEKLPPCPRTAGPGRTSPGRHSWLGLTQDTLAQSPGSCHTWSPDTQWLPPNVAATDQNTPDTLSLPAPRAHLAVCPRARTLRVHTRACCRCHDCHDHSWSHPCNSPWRRLAAGRTVGARLLWNLAP